MLKPLRLFVHATRWTRRVVPPAICGLCMASPAQASWSSPRALGGCPTAPPQIAFPSASPSTPTGPGAIVWLERSADCRSRAAGRGANAPPTLSIVWLGAGDRVSFTDSEPLTSALASASASALIAQGAGQGRVAVAAASAPRAVVLQGHAPRGLQLAAALPTQGSAAVSFAHAYLGDVVLASVRSGPSIAVDVERYYRPSFEPPLRIPIGPGPVTALTAAMDYRSDVLVAWQQDGSIYAHMLRASGHAEPTQRVGPSAPNPELQALVSDDNRGMIAWSATQAAGGSAARTSVYLALSSSGVRFHGRRAIATFADPAGAGLQRGSLALVRLADEGVTLAWTSVEHGHYVVLAVPAAFATVRPATQLTPPTAQAVLAALAPGAGDEALALWRRAPQGDALPDWSRAQLWSTRTFIDARGLVGHTSSEQVGPAGSAAAPAVAVDPADDRAVVAWSAPGAHGPIDYALGPVSPRYRERSFSTPTAAAGGGVHWLRVSIAVIAVAGIALIGWTLRARRRLSAGDRSA